MLGKSCFSFSFDLGRSPVFPLRPTFIPPLFLLGHDLLSFGGVQEHPDGAHLALPDALVYDKRCRCI
jgi:hypothetical protein